MSAERLEAPPATHLVLHCKRCSGSHYIETRNAEDELRRLVAENRTMVVVRCDHDGALSVAELVSVGPGAWKHDPKAPS